MKIYQIVVNSHGDESTIVVTEDRNHALRVFEAELRRLKRQDYLVVASTWEYGKEKSIKADCLTGEGFKNTEGMEDFATLAIEIATSKYHGNVIIWEGDGYYWLSRNEKTPKQWSKASSLEQLTSVKQSGYGVAFIEEEELE